jgi:hypothetical protein
MKIGKVLRNAEGGLLLFQCPGCECMHQVRVGVDAHPCWTWNGDVHRPTFSPSILVRYSHHVPPVTPENMEEWRRAPWPQTKVEDVCHSFVTDGQIQFLSDCTHKLAGQTVPLPDVDD